MTDEQEKITPTRRSAHVAAVAGELRALVGDGWRVEVQDISGRQRVRVKRAARQRVSASRPPSREARVERRGLAGVEPTEADDDTLY